MSRCTRRFASSRERGTTHGVFIYTTLNHIKYALPNGDSGIIRTLDNPVYLTKVFGNVMFCLDRDGRNRQLQFDPSEYMFKLALNAKRFDQVLSMIKSGQLCGQSIIAYSAAEGLPGGRAPLRSRCACAGATVFRRLSRRPRVLRAAARDDSTTYLYGSLRGECRESMEISCSLFFCMSRSDADFYCISLRALLFGSTSALPDSRLDSFSSNRTSARALSWRWSAATSKSRSPALKSSTTRTHGTSLASRR